MGKVTKSTRRIKYLIDMGEPMTTKELSRVYQEDPRITCRELQRAERYGYVKHTKRGLSFVWEAIKDKPPPDMRGQQPGSQDALALSHRSLEVRAKRLRNLRNLTRDAAGNYIPKVRRSTCTLAEVWRSPISSCADD